MSSENHVSSRTPQSFSSYRLGQAMANLTTVATGMATIPILGGGLTNSGNAATSGSFIPRRVTIRLASGSFVNSNVSVGKTNDGSNLICNSQQLSNIGATNSWQDLLINGTGVGNVAIDGSSCQALYLNLISNAAANGSCQVVVYGEVINP